MTGRAFIKMHGLGNDFAIVDARADSYCPTAAWVRTLADRRTGIGFDQMVILEPATDPAAHLRMRIRNADGGEVSACGNAARCVAALILAETCDDRAVIETAAGVVMAWPAGEGRVAVDMGPARTDWASIPLAEPRDTLHLEIAEGPLADPVAVGMGNPHAVFFVADVGAVDLAALGPVLEAHPLFPERTNVEVVQVLDPERLRMRVWERGVGLTRACGTGACAALVAAHRRGLTGRRASVILDGGELDIHWRDDNRVLMTGPVTTAFTGLLPETDR